MNLDSLIASAMRSWAPPPDLTVSQWAERNRRLPASSAARGARWDNSKTPYLVEVMDSAGDPDVRRLVIVGASQVGKSEAILNAVGYWADTDPSDALWVLPSLEDARRRSRGVFADMIRSTPSLRRIIRGRRAPKNDDDAGGESTVLEKVFPGGSVILASSGTPNSFAGTSARRAIADEFERFAVLEEGDAATLLENRTSTFWDGKLIFISTPLLVDGPIDRQFKLTDQRRYVVRCEACRHEAWITWSDPAHFHVVYEENAADTARLQCPACKARHDEPARRRMVAAGRWQPTATPSEAGARGYHLPVMISMLGDVTLRRIVQKWLAARANGPAALMAFINTQLAEPWEDRGGRIQPTGLAARVEDYGDCDAPQEVIALTAGVDVQLGRFEVAIYGWGLRGESWVIDSHVVPGDPTHPEVQSALLATLDERYRRADGVQLPILATAIDAGYLPDKVAYVLAERRPRRILAVKGIGSRFGEPSILKFDLAKPPALVNVDSVKLEIALGLEMAAPGPGYIHLSRRCCDEQFLAQLCAEHRETRRRNGVATMVWVEDRPDNHALDTCVYAKAALALLTRLRGARTADSMLRAIATSMARQSA